MSQDVGLLVLRVGAGLMIAGHGFGKVGRLVRGETAFADPIGIGPLPSLILAALAEFVCALLVVVGFRTRLTALPIVVTMLVAGLVQHRDDVWAKKELALLYAVPFLALVFTGGGRFAVDSLFSAGKPRSRGR
jgi:putative oxidoreductase